MKTLVLLEWGTWLLAVVGTAAAAWAALADVVPTPPPDPARQSDPVLAERHPYQIDSLTEIIVTRNLLTESRRTANVPYDPLAAVDQGNAHRPFERPHLTLLGVVEGPQLTALIRGVPTMEQTNIVTEGDTVAGLLVKTIRNGVVEIVGMDTVWVLSVEEQWRDGR